MHEAVLAYLTGSQCGFRFHNCSLRRYPDYKHTLCPLCLEINSRWPPPPKDPPKPEKDPNLLYPGDLDPEFIATRGDILVVNPAIGPSLRKLGFRGSCVVTYDGSPEFQFVRGDVLVRIGSYEVKIVEPPPKVEDKKGKSKKAPAKAPPPQKNEKVDNTHGAKGSAKGAKAAKGDLSETEKPPEPHQPLQLITYKPHEKIQVYYYTGDNEWRFMGTQENLEMRQKVLLQTQCPGLTAFYRYYKAGTKVLPHTLEPFLGEIILPEWLWQEDFNHKANKWRATGRWYRPDIPDRAKLLPGMILLRPLVGQSRAKGSTLLNTVEMERAKKLEEAKAKEIEDQKLLEKFLAMEKANAAAAAAAAANPDEKDDTKGKRGKKDKDNTKKKEEKDKMPKDDKTADKKNDTKKGGKKEDGKDDRKKGRKELKGEEKKEAPPEVPPPANNDEFLKLEEWGSVEMYRFEGEEKAQGWTYYGRSNRICDTAYPLPTQTTKPKFVHQDDRTQITEPPPEEKRQEPEPLEKDKKGKKGKKSDREEKDKNGNKKDKDKEDKKADKEEKGGEKKKGTKSG